MGAGLPPQYIAQLKQANDSMLTQFAKILTQNVLLLEQADSAKINITPEEWQGLAGALSEPDRHPPRGDGARRFDAGRLQRAVAERSKVAAMKLEEYFDRLVGGKTRLRPLPSALATLLRERSSYRVHDAGINRAIELAQAAEQDRPTRPRRLPVRSSRHPGPAPIPGVGSDTGARQGYLRAPQGTPAPKTTPAPQSAGAAGDPATAKPGNDDAEWPDPR